MKLTPAHCHLQVLIKCRVAGHVLSRDVKLTTTSKRVKLLVSGEAICEGELQHQIISDECALVLHLELTSLPLSIAAPALPECALTVSYESLVLTPTSRPSSAREDSKIVRLRAVHIFTFCREARCVSSRLVEMAMRIHARILGRSHFSLEDEGDGKLLTLTLIKAQPTKGGFHSSRPYPGGLHAYQGSPHATEIVRAVPVTVACHLRICRAPPCSASSHSRSAPSVCIRAAGFNHWSAAIKGQAVVDTSKFGASSFKWT